MITLLMLSVLIFGFMGYRRLPVSDLPNVDFPTILVDATVPGASPETMLAPRISTVRGVAKPSITDSNP